jgi:hypothetical protein
VQHRATDMTRATTSGDGGDGIPLHPQGGKPEVSADQAVVQHQVDGVGSQLVFMAIIVLPAPRCAALITSENTLNAMPPTTMRK